MPAFDAASDGRLDELNRELSELVEQQTATNEVIQAIGRSGFELQPIFETVADHAMRLCRADAAHIFTFDGDHYRLAAAVGSSLEYRSLIGAREISPGQGTLVGRVGLERRPVLLDDVLVDPDYEWTEAQRLGGFRTIGGVPMLSDGDVIGVISLWRQRVDPFTAREIDVALAFAAQGAIAIRNANLMHQLELRSRELSHSLEELQGLHDVGHAVNSSLDLHEVLSTIVAQAVRLSGTEGGSIFEFDAEAQEFSIRAAFGTSEELLDALRSARIGLDDTLVGQAASTRRSLAVADISDANLDAHLTHLLRAGWRSMLAVPLVREAEILGALVVRRRRPGAFPPRIIALVETFASQSAAAIDHARLFKQLEVKSRELEVASRHKSEFLASMSHELRTPLNAVIGFSDVLLDRLFGELTPKQEEYVQDIRDSGQHLLELLNEILDLSKIEAGKMKLELERTSLREALEHGLAMVRERANRQGLSLGLVFEDDADALVADPLRLRQVIVNLLTNAVKFTPAGTVEVSARIVEDEVLVSVKDSGIGIAEADQAKIFSAFQQGPRPVAGTGEGTGLGLTLSTQIVELHGGRLWVESREGTGSTFTFALPLPSTRPAR